MPAVGGAALQWRPEGGGESDVELVGQLRDEEIRVRVPVRRLEGVFWHQGATGHSVDSCPDPALYDGRYTRWGQIGVWYGATRERAAWAELFRHSDPSVLSPFQIKRRVGRVRISGIRILDLTDQETLRLLEVDQADLVNDEYSVCQDLSRLAYSSRLDGVLGPSAALPGERTVVVFAHIAKAPFLTAETSRVQSPPITMVDWLHLIRPVPSVEGASRIVYDEMARLGRAYVRRRK